MTDASNFGGAYFDTEPDSYRVVINTLGNGAEKGVADLVTEGDPIEFVQVEHSWQEILDTAAEITVAYQERRLNVNVSPDPVANRVVVTFVEENEEFRQQLLETYADNDLVTIEEGLQEKTIPTSCNATSDEIGQSRYACTPYRGGTALLKSYDNNDDRCSWTLWARNDSPNGLGHRWMVTAGHCGPMGVNDYWHGPDWVGTSYNSDIILDDYLFPTG